MSNVFQEQKEIYDNDTIANPYEMFFHCVVNLLVQAALVIRGFHYSRSQKPQLTRENSYFETK
jgi:hypothetical protein